MKFHDKQKTRILDIAAMIAANDVSTGPMRGREYEARVLLTAARMVAQLPVILEAIEENPELIHADANSVAGVAINALKTKAVEALAEITKAKAEAASEALKASRSSDASSQEVAAAEAAEAKAKREAESAAAEKAAKEKADAERLKADADKAEAEAKAKAAAEAADKAAGQ